MPDRALIFILRYGDQANVDREWEPCTKHTHPSADRNAQSIDPLVQSIMIEIRYEDALAVKCYTGHLPFHWKSTQLRSTNSQQSQNSACNDLDTASDDLGSKLNQATAKYGYSQFFVSREPGGWFSEMSFL